MNSAGNANGTEKAKIFETVFSSPGMKETCKIVLNPSRQTILLLSHLIEQGIERKDAEKGDELLSYLPSDASTELRGIADELLKKSELSDFYLRVKSL